MKPTMSPAITVRGLTVEFDGVPALKSVDLNISKGHIDGIVPSLCPLRLYLLFQLTL